MQTDSITYLSLCGMLGYGFPEAGLTAGLKANPAFIGIDAGSTDPGPYYLGSGRNFVHPAQVRRDLELALTAARTHRIPLIIGTAGGAGARPHVDDFLTILREISQRHRLHYRLAVIYADFDAETVVAAWQAGRLTPCGSAPDITESDIRQCRHRVGQMGTEPLIQALNDGADVIIAGRCCDTAIFAALPIHRGYDPALALHSAKIAECGTLCAVPGGANDALLVTLERDAFTVCPVNPGKRCLPQTVAAHSLYEQPDPSRFVEPEGVVLLDDTRFEAVDERTVRVRGTRLSTPNHISIKIEGSKPVGHRSLTLAGACDPRVIASLDRIEAEVREKVAAMMQNSPGAGDVSLIVRRYGLDAVTGASPPAGQALPAEVGVLFEAIAPTRELADTAVSLARSTALHQGFPGRKTTAGNFAFPFSPSDFSGGEVYEFALYHLLTPAAGQTFFHPELSQV